MREEEESNQYRQRTTRLAKWRELAEEAAKERQIKLSMPEGLQRLVLETGFECF